MLFAAAADCLPPACSPPLKDGPSPATPGEAVPLGIRIAGAGLIALSLWPARYDIARRTIRGHGVTGYRCAALLTGLRVAGRRGGLWADVGQMADVAGQAAGGGACDAELHAIFSAS